jgi:hypothetical protein
MCRHEYGQNQNLDMQAKSEFKSETLTSMSVTTSPHLAAPRDLSLQAEQ